MILIKGYFGNILYTGDFRYTPEMLNIDPLNKVLQREDLDELYLDNTFFYPTCDFSTRNEVLQRILSVLDKHPDHKVYIGLRKLGKEKLLVEIAQHLRERILVSQERMKILEAIEDVPDVFTTDANASRIHCVYSSLLKKKFMENENKLQPTLAILPSALYFGWDCSASAPYSASSQYNLYVMEYSDHSSYSEILDFVQAVKAKLVKPIVRSCEARGLMKEWQSFHNYRIDMTPLKQFCSKLPQKYFVKPHQLRTYQDEICANNKPPNAKKCRLIQNQEKRIYCGPKGPIYETESSESTSKSNNDNKDLVGQLQDIANRLNVSVNQRNVSDLNDYLDKINSLI